MRLVLTIRRPYRKGMHLAAADAIALDDLAPTSACEPVHEGDRIDTPRSKAVCDDGVRVEQPRIALPYDLQLQNVFQLLERRAVSQRVSFSIRSLPQRHRHSCSARDEHQGRRPRADHSPQ